MEARIDITMAVKVAETSIDVVEVEVENRVKESCKGKLLIKLRLHRFDSP